MPTDSVPFYDIIFSYNDRLAFSTKERDEESGLSYFGARYYSSNLSIWLSVDPMSDKYPSLSPYVYCADNPVKLVDPNGEEVIFLNEAARKKVNALIDKNSPDYNKAYARKFKILDNARTKYCFKEVEGDGDVKGIVSPNSDENIMVYFSEGGERTLVEGGFSKKYATLFEETFHAVDFEKGRLDIDKSTCTDEARAWKFATKAPGTSFGNEKSISFTFAGVVDKLSVTQLSFLFYQGGKAQVDEYGRGEHIMGAEKGLYNFLPRK